MFNKVWRQTGAIDKKEWLKIFTQPVTFSKQYFRRWIWQQLYRKDWKKQLLVNCSSSKGLNYGSHSGNGKEGEITRDILMILSFSWWDSPLVRSFNNCFGAENGAVFKKRSFLFKTDGKTLLVLPNESWSEILNLNGKKNNNYD